MAHSAHTSTAASPLIMVQSTLKSFLLWLDSYGETSYDHQSFYASKFGRGAKALYYSQPLLGTLAVAPMVFCEAFVPSARTLFWERQRFPIADAHYTMGFAFLAATQQSDEHYRRAVHFLEILRQTRCDGFEEYCWGYPFDWQTRTGTMTSNTPLITTVPYVYEAFSQVYALDRDQTWLTIMRSIASHAYHSYRDVETSSGAASCAYTPAVDDPAGVVNASAYRAFLLTKAGLELDEPKYLEIAGKNLRFVLESQQPDGSWFYSMDGERDFVDHFHTCFVLKALAKIEQLTDCEDCRMAIERGITYYLHNLVDESGLPVPFSKAPRFTVYRRELYDFAECVNIAVLLQRRFPRLDAVLASVLSEIEARWRKNDGSFRSRQLLFGWDDVPMHRWAQAQMFRSLCFYVAQNATPVGGGTRAETSSLEKATA